MEIRSTTADDWAILKEIRLAALTPPPIMPTASPSQNASRNKGCGPAARSRHCASL
jgi:hypothetical protein